MRRFTSFAGGLAVVALALVAALALWNFGGSELLGRVASEGGNVDGASEQRARLSNSASAGPIVIPEGAEVPLLVNAEHPLPEGYAPEELVNLYEQKRHFRLARSDIYLERVAFEAANAMFEAAEAEDMNGFILTSGYRSAEHQAEVFAGQQDGTAAEPGASEHETGLAFDVTAYSDGDFASTPQFAWLIEHCWDYGFILRYPEGKEDVTGIPYESWHYRYVGAEVARAIRDAGCTLEEYCAAAG